MEVREEYMKVGERSIFGNMKIYRGGRRIYGGAGRNNPIQDEAAIFFHFFGSFFLQPDIFLPAPPQSCAKTKLSLYKLYIYKKICIPDYEIR